MTERTRDTSRNMMDVSPFDPDYTDKFCGDCGSVEIIYEGICYACWFIRFDQCVICGRPADRHPCEHMIEHAQADSGALERAANRGPGEDAWEQFKASLGQVERVPVTRSEDDA